MIIAAFHDQLLQAATPNFGFAVPAPATCTVIIDWGCVTLFTIS
jgi:hypothetical protein